MEYSSDNKVIVYIMSGLPGSGKSTYVKNNFPDLPIVSRDLIRYQLHYTKSIEEKRVLDRYAETRVTAEEYLQMNKYLTQGMSFVIDDMNNGKYRKGLIDIIRSFDNTYVIGINIDTPPEICSQRREGQIPKENIYKLYEKRIPIQEDEVDEVINIKGY